eukprot:TRINITY_DN6386_c0_g1_i5.p1 TRINITY_DN6386_c0_g1~~TRINITY_DN6386_c0_g1_i5.p1  ORF type:complete len:158 (+),score=37.97 TRINITY_DN6386_c0_g1_i5:2-475(+)
MSQQSDFHFYFIFIIVYVMYLFYFFFFFFFQAEDGIRDAQESRGLGDVYKRQVSTQSTGTVLVGFYGWFEGVMKRIRDDQSQQQQQQQLKSHHQCRAWPRCTDRACPWVHPGHPCPDWPECKAGVKCAWTHPVLPGLRSTLSSKNLSKRLFLRTPDS